MTMRRTARHLLLILSLALGWVHATHAAPADATVQKARDELQLQHYEQARAAAEQATKADPKDYRGHYYLAMAEVALGHAEAARAAVSKARQLAPDSAKAAVEKLAGMTKANEGSGSNASGKETFIKCALQNVLKENAETGFEIIKISETEISWWLKTEYRWVSYCKSSQAGEKRTCSMGEKIIRSERDQRNTTSASAMLFRDAITIDRTTGIYDSAGTVVMDYGNGESKEFMPLHYRGQCEVTSDPAASVPAAKF